MCSHHFIFCRPIKIRYPSTCFYNSPTIKRNYPPRLLLSKFRENQRSIHIEKRVVVCRYTFEIDAIPWHGSERKEKKKKRKHCKCAMHISRVIDYAMSRDIFYLTVNYTDEFSNNKRVLLLTKKLETGIFRAGLMDRCKYNSPVRTSYSERRLMW